MTRDDGERISFCGLLGVVGAVAITKAGLDPITGGNEGIVRWLLYAIACGLIANDQDGKPFYIIFIASIVSSFTLLATITYKILLKGGIYLSGVKVDFNTNSDLTIILLVGLFFATMVAIVMSSYSRGIVLSLLTKLINIEIAKAKRIEAILNKVVSIGAIASVIIFSIL